MTEYPVQVTESLLQEISGCIVEAFEPDKVILFGSRATGTSNSQSDIDLLVIMEIEGSPIERAVAVKRACRPRFVAMDVVVKTPQEVGVQLERGSFFLRQILAEGKILYARHA